MVFDWTTSMSTLDNKGEAIFIKLDSETLLSVEFDEIIAELGISFESLAPATS